MRAALIGFLALCGIALAAMAVAPQLLVVDQYRNKVARFASGRLGRPVRIDGPISLTLLPEPVLSAARVTVGDSGDGVTITAAQLGLSVAIWPLIRGRIDAREVVLRDADLRVPWPPSPGFLVMRNSAWYGSAGARIANGTLQIGGARVSDIAATISASGPAGEYAASGTARMGGAGWRFDLRLDGAGSDGTGAHQRTGLRFLMEGQGPAAGAVASLSGEIAPDGGLDGRLDARGPDLSRLVAAPSVPFTVQGRIAATPARVVASDLSVTLDGQPARTALTLALAPVARLDVALSARQLDLDPWLPVMSGASGVPLPIRLDVWAESARLGGGRARVVHGLFDLSASGIDLREARAVLPGDAIFGFKGHMNRSDPVHPRFEGDGWVTTPSLSTTLAWLERATLGHATPLPERVMRTADVVAHVVSEPGVLALTSLRGRLDGSDVAGTLSLHTAGRPAVGAGLTFDRLDLDPWLPGGLATLAYLQAGFSGFDVDLRLEATQASLAGVVATPLLLDVAGEGGRFILRQLVADANGMHVAASGGLTETGQVTDARFAVQTPDAAPLEEQLRRWLGPLRWSPVVSGLLHGPASLQVQGSGPPAALHVDAGADFAGLHADFHPTIDVPARRWQGAMTLRHPGAPRLASRLGIPGVATWLGDGSLGLVAEVSGMPGRLWADRFDLSAGTLRASGSLTLALGHGDPSLSGTITAESLPLPPLSVRSADPFPLDWLAGWDATVKLDANEVTWGVAPVMEKAATTLSLAAGTLRLEALTAAVSGGTLAGQVSFASAGRPPEAAVDLTVSEAAVSAPLSGWPIDVDSGKLDAVLSVRAFGYSPSAFLPTATGDARVSVRDGTLAGLGLDRLRVIAPPEAMVDALSGGSTPFSTFDLAARIRNGVATLDQAVMASAAGELRVGGRIDLPASVGDLRLKIRPSMQTAPSIVLRLAGPLDAMRRIPDFAALEAWRPAPAMMP